MRNMISISLSEPFTAAIWGSQHGGIFNVCVQPHWKDLINVW